MKNDKDNDLGNAQFISLKTGTPSYKRFGKKLHGIILPIDGSAHDGIGVLVKINLVEQSHWNKHLTLAQRKIIQTEGIPFRDLKFEFSKD